MKMLTKIAIVLALLAGPAFTLRAQMEVPPPMPVYQPLAGDQLDQLLGPIALYPDPLIAMILPASTLPTQIVLADRYVNGGGDPNQIDQQPWNPTVQSLAHYPAVLKWLDDNLGWTTELGQAFLNQPQDVMDTIQRLRTTAVNYGNLQSTPQQQVINDGGYIEIVPTDPNLIYVPIYQPAQVYYQTGGYTPFIRFGVGWPVGVWLNSDFDWVNRQIVVWNRAHPRPANWWHEPARRRNDGRATVWHSDRRSDELQANRGDRGWGSQSRPAVVATVSRSMSDEVSARRNPAPAARPEAPANRNGSDSYAHQESTAQPETHGVLIGIQNSQDTREYSRRGQQSLQAASHSENHSAPATHSTPPSSGSGNHNSNFKKDK